MAKMIEYYLGKSPKCPREFLKYLEFFWHNFRTRSARNSIKGSKDSYSSLESQKTSSQNIGVYDRMMTSYN